MRITSWKAAGEPPGHGDLVFSFSNTEVSAVDTVACCKQITSLVNKENFHIQRSLSEGSKDQLYHHFKDFTQLACGVTTIHCRQVDMLLEDTKHLLDQIEGNSVDLVLTTKKSVIRTNRKRKAVITNESTVTVSKRLRLDECDLLSEPKQHYYANMLSECQVWQSECTQQVDLEKSIELPQNCTQASSYHTITITEEIEIHEEPSNIYPTDGFGNCDEPDLTYFYELYPRSSAKPQLTNSLSTDILPPKMSRLDAILNNPAETCVVCEPSLSFADSVIETTHSVKITVDQYKSTNSRKRKLIIDKCIKYSREQLRMQPFPEEKVVAITTSFERRKTAEELLTKLNKKISLFPDVIPKYPVTSTEDEQCEVTLRSIFGAEYTEDLVKKIFGPLKSRKIIEKNFVFQPEPSLSVDDSVIETTHSAKITHPVAVDKYKSTNSRKRKLIIDKCIKYSREELREKPFLEEKVVAIPKSFERRKTAEELLTKLNKKISVFPDVIPKYPITLTEEQQSEVKYIWCQIYSGSGQEDFRSTKKQENTRKRHCRRRVQEAHY